MRVRASGRPWAGVEPSPPLAVRPPPPFWSPVPRVCQAQGAGAPSCPRGDEGNGQAQAWRPGKCLVSPVPAAPLRVSGLWEGGPSPGPGRRSRPRSPLGNPPQTPGSPLSPPAGSPRPAYRPVSGVCARGLPLPGVGTEGCPPGRMRGRPSGIGGRGPEVAFVQSAGRVSGGADGSGRAQAPPSGPMPHPPLSVPGPQGLSSAG